MSILIENESCGVTKTATSFSNPIRFPDIELDLQIVEDLIDSTMQSHRSMIGPVLSNLEHYRGKRLRPLLVLLTAQATGGIFPFHHQLSAVIELIHTATLVHDDVLDEATLRRHHPSINKRYGNKISILLGDFLFTLAFHLSSKIGDVRICEWIGEATNRVCLGETYQLLQRGNFQLTEEDYFKILDGKTAALTECACRLSACLSKANPQTIAAMSVFGRSIGIAFQIADDLLDFIGSEKTVGKTLGTDLDQLNFTLPIILFLQRIPAFQREEWIQRFSTESVSRKELLYHFHRTSVLEDTKIRALEYIREAQNALEAVVRNSSAYQSLYDLTEWIIQRNQ